MTIKKIKTDEEIIDCGKYRLIFNQCIYIKYKKEMTKINIDN